MSKRWRHCHINCSTIHNSHESETTKCLSADEFITKCDIHIGGVYYTIYICGILFSHKYIVVILDDIDGIGDHYIMWDTPGTKFKYHIMTYTHLWIIKINLIEYEKKNGDL